MEYISNELANLFILYHQYIKLKSSLFAHFEVLKGVLSGWESAEGLFWASKIFGYLNLQL